MKKSQDGFIGILIAVVFVVVFFLTLLFVSFAGHTENVSGIVYNTQNSHLISGNTTFSVRAGIDTYVNQNNESSYCLPPNSPYIALVNKAAADKRIKVNVTTSKYFAIQAPWTCHAYVTVTEVK